MANPEIPGPENIEITPLIKYQLLLEIFQRYIRNECGKKFDLQDEPSLFNLDARIRYGLSCLQRNLEIPIDCAYESAQSEMDKLIKNSEDRKNN